MMGGGGLTGSSGKTETGGGRAGLRDVWNLGIIRVPTVFSLSLPTVHPYLLASAWRLCQILWCSLLWSRVRLPSSLGWSISLSPRTEFQMPPSQSRMKTPGDVRGPMPTAWTTHGVRGLELSGGPAFTTNSVWGLGS